MLKIFIDNMINNNILLDKYLGIRITDMYKNILVAITNILAGIINYFTYGLLIKLNAVHLRDITFILNIVIISSIISIIYKEITNNEEDILKSIVTNTLILGVSLIITTLNYNFINTLVYLFSVSISYLLIMILIHYLNIELSKRKVLLSFKGYPIMLITLGILCMIKKML